MLPLIDCLEIMKSKMVKYAPQNAEKFILERMLAEKANGYIKKGTFTNEVVWGHYSFIFSKLEKKKQNAFKKGMFLFGMVRRDAKLFLQKNKRFKLPKRNSPIEYRGNLNEEILGKVTGTDINHAYWRIAYNLGVISENTYLKGLSDEFKSVRLAALSTMGATKKYQLIKKGELVDDYKIVKGDEQLQKVYMLIRYTCYGYMTKVKKLLGNDFLCYKTDCIYYTDNKENRKKVKDFFIEHELLVKQLV